MSRLVLPENPFNGGFPDPPADEPVRVVSAHHDACGASTRVRLPDSLRPRALHRVHCSGCGAAFEPGQIEEVELETGAEALTLQAELELAEDLEEFELALAEDLEEFELELPEWIDAIDSEVVALEAVEPTRMQAEPARPESNGRKLSRPKLSLPKPTLPAISLPTLKLPTAKLPTPRLPTLKPPSLDPESRSWKLLSIPIAAVLVIGGLILLRGGDEQPAPSPQAAPTAEAGAPAVAGAPTSGGQGSGGDGAAKPSKETKFVRESSYSLAMPAGWERIDPPAGATFAAVAADGSADATLWITQDPKLDFPTFISQSLAQLETLAGSAEVVERIPGPTAETTIVRLAADAPEGQPTYEVTLRVAGPYRYYLATTVQPGPPAATLDGVDLVAGSLTPELEG